MKSHFGDVRLTALDFSLLQSVTCGVAEDFETWQGKKGTCKIQTTKIIYHHRDVENKHTDYGALKILHQTSTNGYPQEKKPSIYHTSCPKTHRRMTAAENNSSLANDDTHLW